MDEITQGECVDKRIKRIKMISLIGYEARKKNQGQKAESIVYVLI